MPLRANSNQILLCTDNDSPDSNTAKSIENAAIKLSQKGVDVWLAEPSKPDTHAKWDFNDSLISQGIEQVKKDLDNAVLYKIGIQEKEVKQGFEESLSKLAIPEKVSDMQGLSKVFPERQSNTLQEDLLQYVEMELEQTRLVNLKIEMLGKDKQAAKAFSQKSIQNRQEMQAMLTKAIQQDSVKQALENLKTFKVPPLSHRGGFLGISERLKQGQWDVLDMQTLLGQIRNKTLSNTLMATVQVKSMSQKVL